MKYFLLSFDDGTVHDKRLVALLNRYGIPGTFNLNSGLEDFVWNCGELPVRRLKREEWPAVYGGHETASHTLTHPPLTELSEEELLRQVGEDCANLRESLGLDEIGFAVPFTQCGEREINILHRSGLVKYIRLSEKGEGFAPPVDPFHISVTALFNEPDIWDKIGAFEKSELPLSVFALCGHSYEFEANGEWEHMDAVLQRMLAFPGVEFLTTMEFVKSFY